MKTIRDQINQIIKDVSESRGADNILNQGFYAAVNTSIKKELPEHHNLASKFAETRHIHTSKAGARTCHYLSFNSKDFQFTENQDTKIDNYYSGGSEISDPYIGRKPSEAEILFTAAWFMANVMDEDGTRKTYEAE